MKVKDRDDINILPADEPFKGRTIALAYEAPFGGAAVYLTPDDATELARSLLVEAREQRGEVKRATLRTTTDDLRNTRRVLQAICNEVMVNRKEIKSLLDIEQLALAALAETEEQLVPFKRAGHDCVCPECFSKYGEHPLDRRPEARGDNDQPFLHVLCNGERVKL